MPVPMRSLHHVQQSLLLSVLLAAFHRSEKNVSLPVVNSRDSSSAAISSDTLEISSPWNSPLTGLLLSLVAEIKPFFCGLSAIAKKRSKPQYQQFIRWRPNTNRMFTAWRFHPIAVASSVVARTRRCSFTTLARKNSTQKFIFPFLDYWNYKCCYTSKLAFNRGRLLNTVKHSKPIRFVTLQPGSTHGDVFISSCEDGVLRLFDRRQNFTGKIFLTDQSFIVLYI